MLVYLCGNIASRAPRSRSSWVRLMLTTRFSSTGSGAATVDATADHLAQLETVSLAYDDYIGDADPQLSPLVISHGMLGSRQNWTSLAKQINKTTGRRVITVDARNHGDSPHTENMSYTSMAADLTRLIQELVPGGPVSLMGHSMGGRTAMMLALTTTKVSIERLVVVDISPLNPPQEPDPTDKSEWNMEHYFHCMKAVVFDQSLSISKARKSADDQLARRISDPGLRAWLLMNMRQDPKTREIGWRMNLDGIHRAFRHHIARIDFPPYSLSTFGKPTLFIGGGESDYIPPTDHDEIREKFPWAEFRYVPGAGHWVHSQKPKDFLDLLLPFLARRQL